jgi:DNA-binding IclR family transcriptional regulator
MKRTVTVNSINRAARILILLGGGINRLSDIHERLDLTKGTTHRLLKTLESSGLVVQDPVTRRYHLGDLILRLASKPEISHETLVLFALDGMKFMQHLSGETVMLLIRAGLNKMIIEELTSSHTIKFSQGKGFTAPIYAGSSGKLLLSEMSDDHLKIILRNIEMHAISPNTITDKTVLLQELGRIRANGYATSFGEGTLGAAAISVPIWNYVCPVAFCVMGPETRFEPESILKELRSTAMSISRKLKGAFHYQEN